MSDPFAAALDAQFHAPGSAAADHDRDSTITPIRVILSRPDQIDGYGQGQIVSGTVMIDIRRSDVPAPAPDDVVHVGVRDNDGILTISDSYMLTDEPISDVEAMTWSCGAVPLTS
ncbi:head-tail joining protein [Sphingobium aromaticiconvertens]|uniref:head-tail joining protein n=1 Tax=Sphingobium aromaticiconvertens TaxID=365341 RepID=UPI0030162C3D